MSNQAFQVQLFPHQQRVVDHMCSHRGLIAIHQTGSGKTIAAIASIAALQKQIQNLHTIVITQVSIKKQFEAEVNKWNLQNVSYYCPKAFMLAMNDESKKPNLDNTFLIIDEAHNIRTNVKINTKLEVTNGQQAYFVIKAASLAKKVLLLTATPIINDPFDIYNLVMMVEGIAPEESINRDAFVQAIEKAQTKQDFFDFFSCKTSFYTPSLLNNTMAVRNDFVKTFTMTNEYYKVYKQIEENHISGDVQAIINTDAEHDSFWTILRRAVNSNLEEDESKMNPKIEWIQSFVQQQVAQNKKSLIYSNWKDAGINQVKKVLKACNIGFVSVTGDMTDIQRFNSLAKYNNNDVLVMLISKAGSEGLDLKGTRNVVLLESNWHASSEQQIIGRAIRQGSHDHLPEEERSVDVYRLMMQKPEGCMDTLRSVDEEMYELAYGRKDPKIQQFLEQVRSCSIEKKACCCNSHRRMLRLKPTSFRKDSQKKDKEEQVMLPTYQKGIAQLKLSTGNTLTYVPSYGVLNNIYKGHRSYVDMLSCKNKQCTCKH